MGKPRYIEIKGGKSTENGLRAGDSGSVDYQREDSSRDLYGIKTQKIPDEWRQKREDKGMYNNRIGCCTIHYNTRLH